MARASARPWGGLGQRGQHDGARRPRARRLRLRLRRLLDVEHHLLLRLRRQRRVHGVVAHGLERDVLAGIHDDALDLGARRVRLEAREQLRLGDAQQLAHTLQVQRVDGRGHLGLHVHGSALHHHVAGQGS